MHIKIKLSSIATYLIVYINAMDLISENTKPQIIHIIRICKIYLCSMYNNKM